MYCIGEAGLDDVDSARVGEDEAKDTGPLCTYMVLNSMDQMSLNVTPESLDVLTEVIQVY